MSLTDDHRGLLRATAFESVRYGLAHHREMEIFELDYPDALRAEKATFVTLRKDDELLGCIGTLRAASPAGARRRAQRLPRRLQRPALRAAHARRSCPGSICTSRSSARSSRCRSTSEDDLLAKLRPGIDGLLIEDGDHVATFLPAMWPRLPTARTFVRALKDKAHLPPDYWSPTIRVFRYTAEEL